VSLRVIPSGVPQRRAAAQRRLPAGDQPRPPDAADLLQRRLFTDRYRVFYDANVRLRRSAWTTTWRPST
jgi:hypothetical protein